MAILTFVSSTFQVVHRNMKYFLICFMVQAKEMIDIYIPANAYEKEANG